MRKPDGNIYANIPSSLPKELEKEIFHSKKGDSRLVRILSHGQSSPQDFWYDQEEDEWVLLLKGAAKIAFYNGDETGLKEGDYLLIPAHCRHRVAWTSPNQDTVWLCLFCK